MCGMFSQEPFGSCGRFGVARVVSEVVLRGLTDCSGQALPEALAILGVSEAGGAGGEWPG